MIRGPVVTRKNAGGSRNGDSARNAAAIWTVTATARMAGLNVLTWLTAYLDECGRNGGKPLTGPALERFLPWSANPDDLHTWTKPPPATRLNPPRGNHRRRPHEPATPAIAMPAHRTSEYLPSSFSAALAEHGARQSVGRTGICYDNAMAESFFGTLKKRACSPYCLPDTGARPGRHRPVHRAPLQFQGESTQDSDTAHRKKFTTLG